MPILIRISKGMTFMNDGSIAKLFALNILFDNIYVNAIKNTSIRTKDNIFTILFLLNIITLIIFHLIIT